jgi:hypothetical protein
MKIKSTIKAGRKALNHNQTVARGMRVRSSIKAGRIVLNHNQTVRKG